MEIDTHCVQCQARNSVTVPSDCEVLACQKCQRNLFEHPSEAFLCGQSLDQCPFCGCPQLYRQKDFNRKVGLAILVAGLVLAYFTYGLSLLVVVVIDLVLYHRVGDVGCCYQCGSLFRQTPLIEKLEVFNLAIHDHYRSYGR